MFKGMWVMAMIIWFIMGSQQLSRPQNSGRSRNKRSLLRSRAHRTLRHQIYSIHLKNEKIVVPRIVHNNRIEALFGPRVPLEGLADQSVESILLAH